RDPGGGVLLVPAAAGGDRGRRVQAPAVPAGGLDRPALRADRLRAAAAARPARAEPVPPRASRRPLAEGKAPPPWRDAGRAALPVAGARRVRAALRPGGGRLRRLSPPAPAQHREGAGGSVRARRARAGDLRRDRRSRGRARCAPRRDRRLRAHGGRARAPRAASATERDAVGVPRPRADRPARPRRAGAAADVALRTREVQPARDRRADEARGDRRAGRHPRRPSRGDRVKRLALDLAVLFGLATIVVVYIAL